MPAADLTSRKRPNWLIAGQAFLVLVTLLTAVLLPRRAGAMLVLPLAPNSLAEIVDWTGASGGTIVGRGPWPGTLIVAGDRAALFSAALRHGALLLAAPANVCGQLPAQKGI